MMNKTDNKVAVSDTRIMATMTYDQVMAEGLLESMIEVGLKGVRLNTAHLTPQTLAELIDVIHEVDRSIVVLVDTKGAEVRTYNNKNNRDIQFNDGDEVEVVCSRKSKDCTQNTIYINIDDIRLTGDSQASSAFEIGDSDLVLNITESIGDGRFKCMAEGNGILKPRQSVALHHGDYLGLASVTVRDRDMIRAAVSSHADIIAHSYVRTVDDIKAVRDEVGDAPVKVWAKIETEQAIQNLKELADVSDGLLVARGDLGNNMPDVIIPLLQQIIIDAAKDSGIASTVATDILHSMRYDRPPTRAEICDAYNIIAAHVDWMLLCNETAQADMPDATVDFLHRMIECYREFGI